MKHKRSLLALTGVLVGLAAANVADAQDAGPYITDAEVRSEVMQRVQRVQALADQAVVELQRRFDAGQATRTQVAQAETRRASMTGLLPQVGDLLTAYETAREAQRRGQITQKDVDTAERALIGRLISLERAPDLVALANWAP